MKYKKIHRLNVIKQFLLWVIIPLCLLLLWLGLNLTYINDPSFTILVKRHSFSELTHWKPTELIAGQKITGKFTALDDNLAIVAVRFFNFERISTDNVIFRIKQEGQKQWYYQNEYKVDQFQPNGLFPFGFTPISNSDNKTYYFEVQSTKGEHNNAIGLSEESPPFITKYQIAKSELLNNPYTFISYLLKKFFNFFTSFDSIVLSIIHFIPLILYLLLLCSIQTKILNVSNMRYWLITLHYLLILLQTFLLAEALHLIAFLILSILWIIIGLLFKRLKTYSLVNSIVFLGIAVISLLFHHTVIAEKAVQWVYIYMLIAIVYSTVVYRFDFISKHAKNK